jgi:hypothetical protein
MSTEDLPGEIDKTPSHDDKAAPSTAPEAEVKPVEGGAEASATETPDEPKPVNKVQQRINQLTREKYEQRQEIAELRAKFDKFEQAKPEVKAEALVAPNEDDFDSLQDYHTANAKYYADVSGNAAQAKVTAADSANKEATAQTQRQEAVKVKKEAFEANLNGKRANFEDFEDIAYGHNFMDLDLAEQIFEMDKGPEVAYHLGSHLDEAERIFSLTPVQRARELTKLEFQVEALKPKKVSDAPDPINPLGNSETVQTDPDKMTADEWRSWRNKQLHG